MEPNQALRERVKELSCLYGVLRLAADEQNGNLVDVLQGVAQLLPPAWQFPEIAQARVVLDREVYATAGFRESDTYQRAKILVNDVERGAIDVVYLEERPRAVEGPFLEEERHLIEAVASEVSSIVARFEDRVQRIEFDEQIRHSNRLATIGQLAAGVAHELNEPLSSILGFAQLALKAENLPLQPLADLRKIVDASLHAREIVRKLRLFARQMPTRIEAIALNDIIEEGLYFIEARCARHGVKVVKRLAPNLALVQADPGQMHQVMTNLIVNAIQAMPRGGRIEIRTAQDDGFNHIIVSDEGCGMSESTLRKIFNPFFTTKDVDQGTGLGLSVVDGIIRSHGGSITVTSELGHGTTFNISLPCSTSSVEPATEVEP